MVFDREEFMFTFSVRSRCGQFNVKREMSWEELAHTYSTYLTEVKDEIEQALVDRMVKNGCQEGI